MSRTPNHEDDSLTPFDLSKVPVAERPALFAFDYQDTEEQTVWYNPLDYDVAVQIHIGSKPLEGKWDDPSRLQRWKSLPPQVRREMQTGIRVFVIPSKKARAIPSEYDMGIQMTACLDQECTGSKSLYCRNRTHTNKQIVGGSYPRLINKGTRVHPLEKPPVLHYALDDERARAKEALEKSQRALQESMHQQGMAIVASAQFEAAQKEVAEAEARLAASLATKDSEVHHQVIQAASIGGRPPAKK